MWTNPVEACKRRNQRVKLKWGLKIGSSKVLILTLFYFFSLFFYFYFLFFSFFYLENFVLPSILLCIIYSYELHGITGGFYGIIRVCCRKRT